MIAGWLAASTHCSCGGRNGTFEMRRAAVLAGPPGTGSGTKPSSRATSTTLTTSSAAML
jgi:hypothetical protein